MLAAGNKKYNKIDKEDATYPTAALESVLLTSTIDTDKVRDFEIIEIPNAFTQTRTDIKEDNMILFMRGKIYELMMMTYPEIYCEYTNTNNKI